MMFVFFIASMDGLYKSGGVGGAQPPPFANTRIRATFPNSKHGDDMMLVFYCTRMGWGGRSPPHCKHIMIRATFPYCTHGDDMMFVFLLQAWIGFTKAGGIMRILILMATIIMISDKYS